MTHRTHSLSGLLVLGALSLCAVGAANASAAEEGYTLHQCEAKGSEGTGTLYLNAECTEEDNVNGIFETVPLEESEPRPVTASGTSNFTLFMVVAGIGFEIQCTGLESVNATATNKKERENHFVSGEGAARFTGCTVTRPADRGCTVPSTLEMVNLTSKTDLVGSTTFKPKEGNTFIVITVSGCSAAALNGEKPFEGLLTSERATAPTQAFTESSGSELFFGGQEATFKGKYHLTTPTGESLGLEKP